MSLKILNQSNAFRQFVLAGNYNIEEKAGLYQWAWKNRVLVQILDKPLSLARLRKVTSSLRFIKADSLVRCRAP